MSLAVVDGELVDAALATVPVTDEGLLRGDGVFEVLRLYGGRPFALDDHLRRMARSAAGLRLEIDLTAMRADVEALAAASDGADGCIRFLVTRGGRRIALLEPLPDLPPALALATVEYAPNRILDGLKTLSYAANMLANRIAVEHGADQALLVTPHGRILEGPTTAFFVALDDGGPLRTPPLEDRILDSITRRRLLGLVDVQEQVLTRDDLREAREAFVASSGREVHPVHAIDGRELPQTPGPRTAAAAAAMRAHIEAELGA